MFDLANERHITIIDHPPDAVRQKAFREGPDESIGVIQDRLAKAGRAIQLGAIEQGARSINAESSVVGAPHSDSVEVFERESDRVHHRVTARTSRILAMLFHALADRPRLPVI